MARGRVSMRNIRGILRLKLEKSLSNREIAKSCGISHTAVNEYVTKAYQAGISWPVPEGIDDTALERIIITGGPKEPPSRKHLPPMQYLYNELKR